MNHKPNFIIIGAMKCGTSTLHTQLAAQPGIFMSTPKEPNYFSDDEQYKLGLEYYRSLFDKAQKDDLCGESSTHYTKLPSYPKTVDRLASYLPQAKWIYIMRHPIDRLISHYMHDWLAGHVSSSIDNEIKDHPEYIYYGLYGMQLKPYIENFGYTNILPVFYEKLFSDSQYQLERIGQFLEYQKKPQWNYSIGVVNASNERMAANRMRDMLVFNSIVTLIRHLLIPQAIRNKIKRIWQINRRPEISPSMRSYLQEIFDKDLKILGEWLDVDLNCENFKAVVSSEALEWVKR